MKYVGSILIVIIIILLAMNGITPILGVEGGQLKELKSSPNGVASETSYEEKQVSPLEYHEGAIEKLQKITVSEKALLVSTTDNYLHVIYATRIGFRDDIEFYYDGSVIQYRSQSRVGYSDMGLNLERYNRIKVLYDSLYEWLVLLY